MPARRLLLASELSQPTAANYKEFAVQCTRSVYSPLYLLQGLASAWPGGALLAAQGLEGCWRGAHARL